MASVARPAPLVIGHRGAPGYRPEHSRSSYELAFALGADSVEPDVVASADGVLVIRHENEISGTTDVAERAEFAHLRTTKTVDGDEHTGWFTEDFTWDQLATLRVRERIPAVRPSSATFDGKQGILRLRDLADIVDAASEQQGRALGMTEFQILWQVEIPLAIPLIVGGLRASVLQVIATATVAAYIGGGGLGRIILTGIGTNDYDRILGGALLVTALALVVDGAFALLQRLASVGQGPRGARDTDGESSHVPVPTEPTAHQ